MKRSMKQCLLLILMMTAAALTAQDRHRVIIESTPGGADVYVKARRVGQTPFGFWAPDGARFTLEIVKDGYEIWSNEFYAQNDIVLDIPLVALPLTDSTGTAVVEHPLVLVSLPEEANVWINGELVGKTPYRMPVAQGSELNIIITKDGYQEWIRNVTITDAFRETIELTPQKNSNLKYWLIPGFAAVSYGLILYFSAEDNPDSDGADNVWPSPPSRP